MATTLQKANTNNHIPPPTFVPLPWQIEPWRDKSPVLLLTGSVGGGKSFLAENKIWSFVMKYPGAQCLVVRKTQDDLYSSVIPTLDDIVIGKNPYVRKVKDERCYIYTPPDGSEPSRLWWRGIKGRAEREKLKSIGSGGSIDMVFMEEGTEFEEADFNALIGRMRGNAAGWRQIIIATNPGPPLHWINRRLIIGGEASVHLSTAHDNKYNPQQYLDQLQTMTGIDKARLVEGLWVDGTGRVIDTFDNKFNKSSGSDRGGNVTLKAGYVEDGGRVVVMVDDGYVGEWDPKAQMFTQHSHPRVFLLGQIRQNGQLAIFYENYKIKTQYAAHIAEVFQDCHDNGWRIPRVAYYDKSAAALRGALVKAGFTTLYPSPSSRSESIKILKENCAADENGFRNIIIHPACHQLIMELSSWSLKDGQPTKYFDHGPDALRYGVWGIFGGIEAKTAYTHQDNPEIKRVIDERMRIINEIRARTEAKLDRALPDIMRK